jgi:hypothetical protein
MTDLMLAVDARYRLGDAVNVRCHGSFGGVGEPHPHGEGGPKKKVPLTVIVGSGDD